jgi:hypothetical protein
VDLLPEAKGRSTGLLGARPDTISRVLEHLGHDRGEGLTGDCRAGLSLALNRCGRFGWYWHDAALKPRLQGFAGLDGLVVKGPTEPLEPRCVDRVVHDAGILD